MVQSPYYPPPPRRRGSGLWIAVVILVVLAICCVCAAAAGLVLYMVDWDQIGTPTPPPALVFHTPTPTHLPPLPTLTTVPMPGTATLAPTPAIDLQNFVPDLSDVSSAKFSFSRRGSTFAWEGTGQIIWPEQSVYEIGDSLFLAEEGKLLSWNDGLDDWVEALPSARLHDNLVYWLRLLAFATPTQVEVEEEGTIFGFFEVNVPQEENIFGVRDLHGSGWYRWDPESGTLVELAYDLVYLDRLGTSNNDMLYMKFESWGEWVVIPERK